MYVKMLIFVMGLGFSNQHALKPHAAKVIIPGRTDNQGNKNILGRMYTKRWPGAAVLMEIAQDMAVFYLAVDVEFV